MQKFDRIDEHMLGSFVDGQLDPANCELVLAAMEQDSDIREQVYQLRRSKDLMRLAFQAAQAPRRQPPKLKRRWFLSPFGLAASMLVFLMGLGGGVAGYVGARQFAAETAHDGSVQAQSDRIVLHISQADPNQFQRVFDYIETFLEQHRGGGQIAVVANAAGLDLLRHGVSPFESRIMKLMREHPNVHFIACANSIKEFRKRKGMEPVIIEEVDSTLPALDQIVQRVQQGWRYVKVESL